MLESCRAAATVYPARGVPLEEKDQNHEKDIPSTPGGTVPGGPEGIRDPLFLAAIDSIPDTVFIINFDGTGILWNKRLSEISGYSDEEIAAGMTPMDFFEGEDVREAYRAIERVMTEGVATAEVTLVTRDGRRIPMEYKASLLKNTGGEVLGVCGVGRDVSEKLAAEREREEAIRLYRTLVETSQDGMFLVSPDRRFTFVSPKTAEMHGFSSPEEMVGMDSISLIAPEELPRAQKRFEDLLGGGGLVKNAEYVMLRKDGTRFTAEASLSLIRDENGNPAAILGTARDITERKMIDSELDRYRMQLEEMVRERTSELEQANRELKWLNRELEGYAETVSHDLRSPITSIRLAGEAVAMTWDKRDRVEDLDAEIRRLAEVIQLSAEQADALINDILALSRAGREPTDVGEVDVSEVVTRILEEKAPLIEMNRVRVSVDEDLGTVAANPTHVYQLFGNIIDNALEYNINAEPALQVNYLGDGGGVHRYRIRDNGPGVPPGDTANIFLPFFKGETGSTGIGLSIVEKIVELYGGEISVSNMGGACFDFTIRDRTTAGGPPGRTPA